MLLFEEDLALRQKITATFLEAQAHIGMGENGQGLALLQQVLQLDSNHLAATDLARIFAEGIK
jgi:hypothetical protein